MVEYDSQNDALTLGDDDSLRVGDYELQYSSSNDQFEVEHPNGEISNVPRSTSGSLVPQGLAESVSAGEALADDGNTYTSVQTAVDNATGWVFVGPGSFSERVSVGTSGITIIGSGYGTHVNPTSNTAFNVSAADVTIQNLSITAGSAGGGNSHNAIHVDTNGDACIFDSITVRGGDRHAINIANGADHIVSNLVVESVDNDAVSTSQDRVIVHSLMAMSGVGGYGVFTSGHDNIISNCIMNGVGESGVRASDDSADCIVIGCRIHNSGDHSILSKGTDNILVNNRLSDGANGDISQLGTGTVLDGNITGPSN